MAPSSVRMDSMERYVDGFVLPVPEDSIDAYRELAEAAGEIWMDHGALAYFEGVGDDLTPDTGDVSLRTFPALANAADGESVIFAFILYESRDHRDRVNRRVMDDPAMAGPMPEAELPFEMERMAHGGFRSLVNFEA